MVRGWSVKGTVRLWYSNSCFEIAALSPEPTRQRHRTDGTPPQMIVSTSPAELLNTSGFPFQPTSVHRAYTLCGFGL